MCCCLGFPHNGLGFPGGFLVVFLQEHKTKVPFRKAAPLEKENNSCFKGKPKGTIWGSRFCLSQIHMPSCRSKGFPSWRPNARADIREVASWIHCATSYDFAHLGPPARCQLLPFLFCAKGSPLKSTNGKKGYSLGPLWRT